MKYFQDAKGVGTPWRIFLRDIHSWKKPFCGYCACKKWLVVHFEVSYSDFAEPKCLLNFHRNISHLFKYYLRYNLETCPKILFLSAVINNDFGLEIPK